MRRSLVVVVLMISSVLLLQAPAWAPHLYRLQRTDKDGGKHATWKAYINCPPGSTATITSGSFMGRPTAKVGRSDLRGYKGKISNFYSVMRPRAPAKVRADGTCSAARSLALSGSRVLEQLVLGIGLLLLGGLFVLLGAHPSIRRRST